MFVLSLVSLFKGNLELFVVRLYRVKQRIGYLGAGQVFRKLYVFSLNDVEVWFS